MPKRTYDVTSDDELYTALTCSICLDLFKSPRQLPNCSHTFCSECLQTLVAAIDAYNLDCPNCRKRSLIPAEGVKGFQVNIVAQQLVDKLNMEKAEETRNSGHQADIDQASNKCIHLFNNTRAKCAHCGDRFCEKCMSHHLCKVRSMLFEVADSVEQRLAVLDWKLFEEKVGKNVDDIQRRLDDRKEVVRKMLDVECDRVMSQAKSLASQVIDSVRQMLTQNNTIQKRLADLKADPDTKMQADEFFSLREEVQTLEKSISEAEGLIDKKVPINLGLEADTNSVGKCIASWKVTDSADSAVLSQVLDATQSSVTQPCKQTASVKRFYETMSAVNPGGAKDAFGSVIRLPRRICVLNADRVAIVHEMNRISILGWNGRVHGTLKIFYPGKPKKELYIQEIASDSSAFLFVIGDGTVLGKIPSSSKMPECVMPTVHAMKIVHTFRGVAVCPPRGEVFTGEGGSIAVYCAKELIKTRSIMPVPEPYVLGCVGLETYCQIFFSNYSQNTLGRITASGKNLLTVALKGAGPGEIHQVTGVSFDEKDNILVADARNHRIQIFLAPNYEEAVSVALYGSNCEIGDKSNCNLRSQIKPFGVAYLPSNSGQTARIVVPDYSGHTVWYYECKHGDKR